MDEYIELLNDSGKPTGKRCLKSIAHKNGFFHASVHIWFYTEDNKILIQKRKHTKETFPNLWDVSVAGHIAFGELPIIAALREIKEEIGVTTEKNHLNYIGQSIHKNTHSKDLIDHELHHIYISTLNTSFETLQIQEDEVAEIQLISIDDFKDNLLNTPEKFVPHGAPYYERVIEQINQERHK